MAIEPYVGANPLVSGQWWHLVAVVNGRPEPSISAPVSYVGQIGHNINVVDEVINEGRTWLKTDHGLYYAKEFARVGEADPRPESPVPGYGPGYPYGVKNDRYIAGFHTGQDYPAPIGTPFVAVVSGRISRYIGGAYGKGQILRGDNNHEYLYAHAKRRRFPVGKRVKRGQIIGWVDSTGLVTGPHLHLEESKGARWSYGNVKRPTW